MVGISEVLGCLRGREMVVVLEERIGKRRFLVGGEEENSWWVCEGNWWGALGVEKALLLLEMEERK